MAFFILLLGLQDPSPERLRGLVELLDDDSIERREEAEAELLRLGRAAFPALRGKARGRELIERIEGRERLLAKIGDPTLLTVEAKDRPLREILEELCGKASTPLRFDAVAEGRRVTVSLSKVPFWDAIDRLCRAADVGYEVELDEVILGSGSYRPRPLVVSGSYAAFIRESEPGVREFRVCWERGARPIQVRCRLGAVADGDGRRVKGLEEAEAVTTWVGSFDTGSDQISTWHNPRLEVPATASSLDLRVEFDHALSWAEGCFPLPESGEKATVRKDGFEAGLLSFGASFGAVELELSALFPVQRELNGLWCRGKGGREYFGPPSGFDKESGRHQFKLKFPRFYELGDSETLKELWVRTPVEVHTERVRFVFKGLGKP